MGRLTQNPWTDEWHFTPNMVARELMPQLFKGTRAMVKFYGLQLLNDAGWKFYVVRQTRGRCYYKSKVITIPSWVIERKSIDYKEWYLSHEMAHAYSYIEGTTDNHGPAFMAMLKAICPDDCVHYEIEYKPRNAQAAGIRKPGSKAVDDFDDLF